MVATLQRTRPGPGRRLRPLVPTLQPRLLLEGKGTQGSTGPPGTKGLRRGPEEPEGCSTKTSSRQAQPTGRGVGSRPQSAPLSCARSGESWRQGSRQPAGHADTVSHASLGRRSCLESVSSRLYCPPGRQLPELPSQGPPLRGPPRLTGLPLWAGLLYWGLLDGRGLPLWGAPSTGAALMGPLPLGVGLLYWGLLDGRSLPLRGPPLQGPPSMGEGVLSPQGDFL